MRRPGGWWRLKSTPEKVEAYTRWSFHFYGIVEIAVMGLSAFGRLDARLAAVLFLTVTAHATVLMLVASRALDWELGQRGKPVQLLRALAVLTVVVSATALLLAKRGAGGDDVGEVAGMAFGGVVTVGSGVLALGARNWRHTVALVTGFAAGSGVLVVLLGAPVQAGLATACVVLLGSGFVAFACVFSVWLLNAVYALDEAKETRARLAVAEERLRFGRDLHDVMGRNLAVIALKSELAVQLARRGRPEAVEQMIETQRIAQETQREVRDVVRGYREVALEVELAGAQGVLSAAGILSQVTGETGDLPGEVQSALGWVVREATTNVLRHGDAEKCSVTIRPAEGRVVLTVENDGVPETTGAPGGTDGRPAGSGLAGLRERLAAVGGTLEAGAVGKGVFRLTAEVPLPVGGTALEVAP
ncbi:sensor histidine kinase [Streptomyces rubrogriseus]|uniref:sensor histidine kinase n=1 Tax=Streptomyces rubrogriseus TaxID=194673 RepID=UPI000D598FB3|nr:histidine kinase [Streptomyces rubrogriseus]